MKEKAESFMSKDGLRLATNASAKKVETNLCQPGIRSEERRVGNERVSKSRQ